MGIAFFAANTVWNEVKFSDDYKTMHFVSNFHESANYSQCSLVASGWSGGTGEQPLLAEDAECKWCWDGTGLDVRPDHSPLIGNLAGYE